ncbi:MAG: hypothetical protein [Cressdnaviricota sp.]|nr:MAG: hypothetical protein [Cressdnaviricota sp.]
MVIQDLMKSPLILHVNQSAHSKISRYQVYYKIHNISPSGLSRHTPMNAVHVKNIIESGEEPGAKQGSPDYRIFSVDPRREAGS